MQNLPMNPLPSQVSAITQQMPSMAEQEDKVDLAKYLNFLLFHRWLIISVTLSMVLLSAAYVLIAKPIYQANILIQVEDSSGTSAGSGAGASKNIQGDLSGAFDIRTVTASEIEVLRSRAVVSGAADHARLYISVHPKYFPVIGEWIARGKKELSDPGLFGYGGYVWGAERADVSIFNVPEELEGLPFTLAAAGNGTFQLIQEKEKINIEGKVGETVKARSPYGLIELRIAALEANPGALFTLIRSGRLDTVERLQNALRISEMGKQSGIIGVTLDGPDPTAISGILNEIGKEYIRQNVEKKSKKAEKSLAFLDKQLPDLKDELERSENRLKAFRFMYGTIDLGEEGRSLVQQSVWIQTRLAELKQRSIEVASRFESEHPSMKIIERQERELNQKQGSINEKIKRLPAIEQEMVRLNRDVKVNTELYTTLVSTAQQLRLVTSSEVGNARLLDPAAKPVKPIKPKRSMVLGFGALLGLVLGVISAFVRKSLHGGIDDPQEIKQVLGLPVNATIPHSSSQARLYSQIQNKAKSISVLAHNVPSDNAIESLRSFRASLQYSMRGVASNIIVITSPTPGVGKSFVSANFATVLASVGKKVLLIDGDLRKGYLHRHFGLERGAGLSDVIEAREILDQIIHRDVVDHVDFISTGHLPRKPAELLSHENFARLLDELSPRYDYVLIDTAPVLTVADALTISPHGGAVFTVVRGGISTVGEIDETVKRLTEAGATVTGAIFNDLRPGIGRYGYQSDYGHLQYAGSN
jgi:tyrosine-protein kinase Etk/Wzc